MSSLKRTLVPLLLACTITLGFVGGRRLHDAHPLRLGKGLSAHSLLFSSASNERGFGRDEETNGQDSNVPPANTFESVLDYVQSDYVEGYPSGQQLSNGALSQMVAALKDPKTSFLDPALRKARQEALNGRYQGIGAALTVTVTRKEDVDYRYLSVVAVMPGSPAEKAGLKTGDHITEINGHWINAYAIRADALQVDAARLKKMDEAAQHDEEEKIKERFSKALPLNRALTLLSTGTDKSLQLTFERAGQPTPIHVDLTTAATQITPVEFHLVKEKIGYLRIRQFNGQATGEFLNDIAANRQTLKGLIVDLRSNPGGVTADSKTPVNGYDSALKLIAALTPGGKVAAIERKQSRREPVTVTPSVKSAVLLPLVVLVDAGTANLSELVAAALRDAGKAKVIGTRTFGDDVLQYFTVLKDGSGLEIAHAHFLTASGAALKQGVSPDVTVASSTGSEDAALDRALATLGAS